MSLKVVGAGLGRTGTMSLKVALERLLGAPCYHMVEVFAHPEHVPAWHAAALGQMPDWHKLLDGYAAAVDWPASAYWQELSEAFPEALIVLSVRDTQSWWQSAHETIFSAVQQADRGTEWHAMIEAMFANRFMSTTNPSISALQDAEACMAAFDRHNAHVRATAPPQRLLEWRATEGWEPLCKALGLPVPDMPFPRINTREDWAARRAGT